jgi:signal-transduction protein with cAMP-binding, CBS, and nucleotidyltransferase domain
MDAFLNQSGRFLPAAGGTTGRDSGPGGEAWRIVTDRDIAVRAVAEERDPQSTSVSEICSSGVATLEPEQSIDAAVQAMREHDVRRLPVVKHGRPVGILSLGDLAVERDPESVLADISAGSPDQ